MDQVMFMKRHPGVKRSLMRYAVVGGLGGGLVVAGMRSRGLARELMQHELPIIRARRAVLAPLRRVSRIQSRGFKALLRSLEDDTRRLKGHAVKAAERQIRFYKGAVGVGGVGGVWATMPAAEDFERHRERREASRQPGFRVFRKRRRAT
jgi:hypothetical protein